MERFLYHDLKSILLKSVPVVCVNDKDLQNLATHCVEKGFSPTLHSLLISYNGFQYCIVSNSELLIYSFSNKDDVLFHIQHETMFKKKSMFSIPGFEVKRPSSYEG